MIKGVRLDGRTDIFPYKQTLLVASPNVSSGNGMIVPKSSFRCGLAIESIAQAIDD
jgi:hypothetical protein